MKLGIVSPSAPSTHSDKRKEQFNQGLETLKTLNIDYTIAPHAEDALSYVSSSKENRLEDLQNMYADPSIDMLVAANGGWNASHLLDGLDWSAIQHSKKALLGFSDTSVLLNAIYSKTGLQQFHGPMVTWGFYENDSLTNSSFQQAVSDGTQSYSLEKFGEFWKGSDIQGVLVGGNLVSVRNLIGTPFVPDWNNKIFFWEETEETIYRLDRELTHYKNAGVFDKIAGMIIGHLDNIDEDFGGKQINTKDMIMNHLRNYDFPILKTDLFGHGTSTNITIPIGGNIRLVGGKVMLTNDPVVK